MTGAQGGWAEGGRRLFAWVRAVDPVPQPQADDIPARACLARLDAYGARGEHVDRAGHRDAVGGEVGASPAPARRPMPAPREITPEALRAAARRAARSTSAWPDFILAGPAGRRTKSGVAHAHMHTRTHTCATKLTVRATVDVASTGQGHIKLQASRMTEHDASTAAFLAAPQARPKKAQRMGKTRSCWQAEHGLDACFPLATKHSIA